MHFMCIGLFAIIYINVGYLTPTSGNLTERSQDAIVDV
jgi:hypothetical protein